MALGRLPFDYIGALGEYCARFYGQGPRAWQGWAFASGNPRRSMEPDAYHKHIEYLVGNYEYNAWLHDARRARDVGALLAQGASLLSYRGHGTRLDWKSTPLVDDDFVDQQPKRIVDGVVSVACCTAAIDLPSRIAGTDCGRCESTATCVPGPNVGAAWLHRGAAAWFIGSSRKSFRKVNDVFNELFTEAVVQMDILDVGGAFRYALGRLAEPLELDGSDRTAEIRDGIRMAVLLGDPAWPLPRPGDPR
jgi:hypothetical protein